MTIGTAGIYLLEVSTILILLYIFNKQLLGSETLHRLNRSLWLATIGIAFGLPPCANIFTEQTLQTFTPSIGGGSTTESMIEIAATQDGTNLLPITLIALAAIYSLGTTILLIHNLISYSSLLRLVLDRRYDLSKSTTDSDTTLLAQLRDIESRFGLRHRVRYVIHDKDIAPFSWFNFVVISRKEIESNYQEIVIHELAHTAQHHSIDVTLLNIATIVLWFNPAAWLTKRALQQVHEYCADQVVLSQGINAKEYQLLLIKKAVGARSYTISNSLNHSNLKNRITMMLQKKSSRMAAAKCLYAIPLAISAIALFSSPAFAKCTDAVTEVKVTNYFNTDKTDEPQKVLYYVNGMIISNGEDIAPERIESITVIKKGGSDKWKNHKAWETVNQGDYNGIIEITLKKAMISVDKPTSPDSAESVLHIINAKTVKKETFDNINKSKILNISVIKDANRVKAYDSSGKYNAVMEMTLKDGETIASAQK